jgi:hypothetical protein
VTSPSEAGPTVRLERRALRDGAYDRLLTMLLDGPLEPDRDEPIPVLRRAHVHRLRQTVGVGLTDSPETSAEHARILAALETSAPDQVVSDALRDHLEAVRARSVADSKLDGR